jgi:sulfate transport system ATP-binding protein
MSIRLEQVTKYYAGGAAVSDASLDIADAEFFVLLGPSGSGKSTLLRAIAGLTPIDHGRILLRGRDVTNLNAREREVGFVFQNYALFPHMSVGDNIEFALRARRVRAAQRRARRAELLRLVALEGFDDRLPAELSGGQQQRVAVARALAHEPRVLLLDEPFGALDAKIREELRRTIREIQRKVGITSILVTHDQEEALTMADRIGVMDRGRLQEVGAPQDLYARPATRFTATFLGAANLLLGEQRYRGVRLGQSVFAAESSAGGQREGDEVTAVVRPEDLALAPTPDELPVAGLGGAKVVELQFVGGHERVRLLAPAARGLVGALRPAAGEVALEAVRSAREAVALPLAVGQDVCLGIRRVHVLPTPISSLRLVAPGRDEAEALACSPLVRELAAQMRIEPVRHQRDGGGQQASLSGLPIVALDADADTATRTALETIGNGARQVLAVAPGDRPVERMVIYVETQHASSHETLAAAASIVRHLAIDVVLLVPAEERPRQRASYREILDLRSVGRLHGLDARTETFGGEVLDAIRRHLAGGVPTLLVVGLEPTMASGLCNQLDSLFRVSPPAAVLLVRGSTATQQRVASAGFGQLAARGSP